MCAKYGRYYEGVPDPQISTKTWVLVFVIVGGFAIFMLAVVFGSTPVAEPSPVPDYIIEPEVTITARP